jgi:sodium/hydrogen antiporter
VLSSGVVNNPRVPRIIRHSLNLESGLNDGLALPAVLAFTAAAESRSDFTWWQFVIQDVGVGAITGLVLAFVAARLMPQSASPHQKALYALGTAFAAYGAAVLPPEGNGFICVFVAAIALGIWRPDIRDCFESRSEDVLEVVKLGVFLVFGAIFTFDTLFHDGWAAVAIVAFTLLVARPAAVFAALTGTRQVDTAGKAFIAWFGPKGVAGMLFAVLVLNSDVEKGNAIFEAAAFVILASILIHGATDTLGAKWIERRIRN